MSIKNKTRGLAAVLGGCVVGASALVALAPAAAADGCSDVAVVFARGTGEPAGVGAVGQSFIDSLRSKLRGDSVSTYAVNYPASDDFMKAAEGAGDLNAQVTSIAASCPNTSIVMGGYSQGAAVVDLVAADPAQAFGFGQPISPDVAAHVAAVAVFGNPSMKIGKPLVANSPLLGARTVELCNANDPVCSPGEDRAAHSQYPQSGLTAEAASFVAGQVRAGGPDSAQLASAITPQ